MTGNPFRRSMAVAPSGTAQPTFSTTADAPTTPQQRTKKKRVKIESPPHATQNHGGRRLSASDSAMRAPSPPPPDRSDDEDDDEAAASDSTATADSDLDQATRNARRNSGSLPPPTTGMAGGMMKAPYDPFARTLATKEASFGLQQDHGQSEEQRTRPAMDVDAFKNILLTGRATAQVSTASAAEGRSSPAVSRPHDSGSSTDTSSIFDAAYTLHPESPRVDHYDFHSTSDSDEDNDTDDQNESERTNLMGQGRLDDLPPPAPPKPISTRGPQTVSFADFDQSIPPNFQAPGGRGTPPLTTQHRGILRPTIHRSASDLNKPLPPPPAVRQPSDTISPPTVPEKDVPQPQQHLSEPTLTLDNDLSAPKKVPPPPPASRRQAATPGRARSASNLSAQESVSDNPDPKDPSNVPLSVKTGEPPGNKQSHPPPPPPARKVHPVTPSSAAANLPMPAPVESKPLVPLPPPRRHPSASGSTRTASPASSLRKDISSLPLSGSNAPPPPPPPRRAAGGDNSSQRSSIDGRPSSLRKISGVENQRRASKQSVDSAGCEQAAPSPSTEAAKRDVLADMETFQAEIDALRLQAGGGK